VRLGDGRRAVTGPLGGRFLETHFLSGIAIARPLLGSGETLAFGANPMLERTGAPNCGAAPSIAEAAKDPNRKM